MNYDFALRAQNSGQPMIRIVDAYMRRDPTFLAFAEGNPALEACPKEAIAEIANDLLLNHDEQVLLYSNNGGDPEFTPNPGKILLENPSARTPDHVANHQNLHLHQATKR